MMKGFLPTTAGRLMLASTLVIGLAVSASAQTPNPEGLRPVPERQTAPDFTLTDANGATITLSSYKGSVILLDFWATWCTGCKVEIPWYIEFQEKYRNQGLSAIGAAMDEEGWPIVKPYLAAHPINYPIVLGNPDLIAPYQVTNMPVTLLIDREGRIADAHVGVVVKESWEAEIQHLLAEEPSRSAR